MILSHIHLISHDKFQALPQLFKHILTIIGVIALAHAFVPSLQSKGMGFDPMDADDFATFSENSRYTTIHDAHTIVNKKEITAQNNHKHSKRTKPKRTNVQVVFTPLSRSFVINAGVDDAHTASLQKQYRHLFYRDINPPPRYS